MYVCIYKSHSLIIFLTNFFLVNFISFNSFAFHIHSLNLMSFVIAKVPLFSLLLHIVRNVHCVNALRSQSPNLTFKCGTMSYKLYSILLLLQFLLLLLFVIKVIIKSKAKRIAAMHVCTQKILSEFAI